MKACVGDRLLVDGNGDRVGLVIGVQHEDGTPPYVIKWLSDGHVALVFPGEYARIVPASHPAGTARTADMAGNGTAGLVGNGTAGNGTAGLVGNGTAGNGTTGNGTAGTAGTAGKGNLAGQAGKTREGS